jgi:hypothetical protein
MEDCMNAVAVVRDTVNGDCFLVACDSADGMDAERLEWGGLELAGWLRYPQQHDSTPNTDELKHAPYFTTCEHEDEHGKCERLILIVDDMAPEYCTEHEEDN